MKTLSSIIFSLVLILGIGFSVQHASAQTTGCFSTGGYSTTTGMACNGATMVPAGCTTTAGFSGTTGTPCNGVPASVNGYNGSVVGTNGYLNGCTSAAGYSATTGYPCNMSVNGVVYTGNGTTVVTTATPTPTTVVTTTTSPGLPTTGAGQNTLLNLAVLLGSATVAVAGIRYGLRHSVSK